MTPIKPDPKRAIYRCWTGERWEYIIASRYDDLLDIKKRALRAFGEDAIFFILDREKCFSSNPPFVSLGTTGRVRKPA